MLITNEIENLNNSAVVLGAFDGIHKAHQVLIKTTVDYAKQNGIKSAVFTFDVNPKESQRIMSDEAKTEVFESLGVDILFVAQFDHRLKNTSPDAFLEKYIQKCKFVCVGYNFKFGKDRQGNTSDIIKFCKENNIEYKIIDEVKDGGKTVSSTLIREYIKSGKLSGAKELLGRDLYITGTVVAGDKIGKQLGFPTINTENSDNLIPDGVYATLTEVDGKIYKSVTNVGGKPTIRDKVNRIETHIIDFDKDIYGHTVKIIFIEKIRDTVKFDNIELLKQQLKKDIAICKKMC